MSGTDPKKVLGSVQLVAVLVLAYAMIHVVLNETEPGDEEGIAVIDTSGEAFTFDAPPDRIVVSNTYAATAMRMLDADMESVVGVSGDFTDSELWPELSARPWVQFSAHSEIDLSLIHI